MSRIKKIKREPIEHMNYYIVDANFLARKYLPEAYDNPLQNIRVKECKKWWKEIDKQVKNQKAKVFIPDICIAEAFKVIAQAFYQEKTIKTAVELNNIRNRLSKDIRIISKELKKQKRYIGYHDISTCRDLIISVDRFFEAFYKNKHYVQIVDLILVATAKYLIDFYDIPKEYMSIITLDGPLYAGARKIQDLPTVYDPTKKQNRYEVVFE